MQNILEKTEQLCKLHKITPQRSKGQNFLIVEDYYDQIIKAAEITKDDLVLEVGPGLGFLTQKLAEKAKKVVTVELDDKLADLLKGTIAEQKFENVSIINGNVLDIEITPSPLEGEGRGEVGDPNKKEKATRSQIATPHPNPLLLKERGQDKKGDYKIVANLPYNITSVFLRKFLEQVKNKPTCMVLMLQKEVAERIVAKPGEMSILAISVQYYADAEIIIEKVPAKAFWPAPKVDSAVIRIRIKNQESRIKTETQDPSALAGTLPTGRQAPPYQGEDLSQHTPAFGHPSLEGNFGQVAINSPLERGAREAYGVCCDAKDFFRLVKFGFSAKRKKLSHNLSAGFHIEKSEALLWMKSAGINDNVRAQELSLEDWHKLLSSRT